MKNLKLITLFLTVILFGCSKKGGGGEQTGQYFIKGTVDGAVKVCSAGIIGHSNIIENIGTQIMLNGRYGSATAFGGFDITINTFNGVGTYLMAAPNTGAYPAISLYRWEGKTPPENYIYSSAGNNGSGKVVVTSYANNVITGTFEFTGESITGETKTVTDGSFEVKVEAIN